LVTDLAREATTVAPRWVDPGWGTAISCATPGLLALLEDPAPPVRRAAAELAAVGGLPWSDAVAALWRRHLRETDRVTRWDLVVALGRVLGTAPTETTWHDRLHAELVRLATEDEDRQLRLAALQALGAGGRPPLAGNLPSLVAACTDPDVEAWRESAWIGGGRSAVIRWTGALLRPEPGTASAFLAALGVQGPAEQRLTATVEAGRLLAEWRTADAPLLPFLRRQLDDRDPEVRYHAVFLHGCLGVEAAAHADRIAALTTNQGTRRGRLDHRIGDAALWALSRFGDARCVPGLHDRLTGRRLGFETASNHVDRGEHLGWLPSLDEVLTPLAGYADALGAAVVDRLDRAADEPTVDVARSVCAVIEAWGPLMGAATPVLLRLLGRNDTRFFAARALGGIGPAAEQAAEGLARLAAEEVPGRDQAAWALWRTTGQVELPLHTFHAVLAADRVRHTTVERLADLGPLAAECAPRLRHLIRAEDPWMRTRAAYALWRCTGDPGESVATLTDLAHPLKAGDPAPVARAALRHLAEIGATDGEVLALARSVSGSPRRLAGSGDWRTFTEDEEIRAAAAQLLADR
jgi:HEAT repeat protein